MKTQLTSTPSTAGNQDDPSYEKFLHDIRVRFEHGVATHGHLFTTDTENLWAAYLDAFEGADRQHHNCNACRHFVERFGSLVTIDDNGVVESPLWYPEDAPEHYREAVVAMKKLVERAKITGVFISDKAVLGTPKTDVWVHISAVLPVKSVSLSRLHTPGQLMAEKKEDFKNTSVALSLFTEETTSQMMRILEADALYRAEKVIGPARWFHGLVSLRKKTKNKDLFSRLLWRAVAAAPAGFAHVRSSMTGTLLDDIAAGLSFDDVSRKFAAKMAPLQYARPQAAPSSGNILAAEKIVEKLGIEPSLHRRFCLPSEVETFWTPPVVKESVKGGVFSHLKPKDIVEPAKMSVPSVKITWVKFRDTVLPGLSALEVEIPNARHNFVGFLTAVNPEAPRILAWDTEAVRNPVSWYVYNGGSTPSHWNLQTNRWIPVEGLCHRPSVWKGNDDQDRFGKGVVLLLPGAKDTGNVGACLFPEILKSELREIRSTIEAFSNRATVLGREGPQACGLLISKDGTTGRVRGRTEDGASFLYEIDRWD